MVLNTWISFLSISLANKTGNIIAKVVNWQPGKSQFCLSNLFLFCFVVSQASALPAIGIIMKQAPQGSNCS